MVFALSLIVTIYKPAGTLGRITFTLAILGAPFTSRLYTAVHNALDILILTVPEKSLSFKLKLPLLGFGYNTVLLLLTASAADAGAAIRQVAQVLKVNTTEGGVVLAGPEAHLPMLLIVMLKSFN